MCADPHRLRSHRPSTAVHSRCGPRSHRRLHGRGARARRTACAAIALATVVSLAVAPVVSADPGNAAASSDPCQGIGPMLTPTPDAPKADLPGENTAPIIAGDNAFGVDNLLRPTAQALGINGSLPQGQVFPNFRVFDPSIQGEGTYNEKTSLQSGLVCSLADSLAKKKIRRDLVQKIVAGLFATPTLLAGLEGPDIAALVQSGVACGIDMVQAAAAGAAAGGSAGAAATAAAPAAISAGPVCVAAAGDAARIAGKVINVWEHNPYFPQVSEFAAVLDPDSPIGREVYDMLPAPLQRPETIGIMKTLSRFDLKLSEVWVGKSIAIFGDATAKAAQGDTSAVPGAAIAAIELGIQVLSAATYALTGSDTFSIGGESLVDTKQLVNQMSLVYSGGLTRLPGEGSEVVAGGALGGQQGTEQQLQQVDLNNMSTNLNGKVTNCLMGTGTGVNNMTAQFNSGYGQSAATGSGACTSSPYTIDHSQMLSQADVDQIKNVPGLAVPKSPTTDPSGAIWNLDANNPTSLLAKIPLLGSASGGSTGTAATSTPNGLPSGLGGTLPGLSGLTQLAGGTGLPTPDLSSITSAFASASDLFGVAGSIPGLAGIFGGSSGSAAKTADASPIDLSGVAGSIPGLSSIFGGGSGAGSTPAAGSTAPNLSSIFGGGGATAPTLPH